MEELVEKARAGDEEAFARLVRGMRDALYRTAWAILRSDADAADALQEATVRCWQRLDDLDEPAFFKTWATRILVNECRALIRRRKDAGPLESAGELGSHERGFELAEWQMLLSQLTERSRTVIVLHYVEGYKVAEVARIMDANENTVKTWLAVARSEYESLTR